jgi:hypothetical protein
MEAKSILNEVGNPKILHAKATIIGRAHIRAPPGGGIATQRRRLLGSGPIKGIHTAVEL